MAHKYLRVSIQQQTTYTPVGIFFQNIKIAMPLMLQSGPITQQYDASKANQCM